MKVEKADFKNNSETARKNINTWAEEYTNHLIKDAIP